MLKNELLLRVVAGSHLYGYSTPESDYDFFEVYSAPFSPSGRRTAPVKSRQTIVDGVDTIQMSLSHFVEVASDGSHQALDAMFASAPLLDRISALRNGFRAGFQVIPTYERIITKFALQGTPRKQRHAVRTALNLAEIMESGRYTPELSSSQLKLVAETYILPPSEFRQELVKISPVDIRHYFI